MKSMQFIQQCLLILFCTVSTYSMAQPGHGADRERPEKPDRPSINKERANSESGGTNKGASSADKAHPGGSEKGTCHEWENNGSGKQYNDHPTVTTKEQCEKINAQNASIAGPRYSGADYKPPKTSSKSEESNCDLPTPSKKHHRLPDQ